MNRGILGGLALTASLLSTLARAHTVEGLGVSDLDQTALEPQLTSVERDIDDGVEFAATAPLFEPAAPTFEGFVKPAFGVSKHWHASEALAIGVAPAIERADALEIVLPFFAEASLGPCTLGVGAAYHVIDEVDELSLDIALELPLWEELSLLAIVKAAGPPTLQEGELRTAGGFSWKPREDVSLMALAGNAIRDVPFETGEQLFMMAARADW